MALGATQPWSDCGVEIMTGITAAKDTTQIMLSLLRKRQGDTEKAGTLEARAVLCSSSFLSHFLPLCGF